MELNVGDILSGKAIELGRFEGETEIDSKVYYKVMDVRKKAMHFIPVDKLDDIRKLPSKDTVQKNLIMFDSLDLVDEGLLEGSRYKYFKEKLSEVNFQKSLEVLHDLAALHFTKEISSSERKLFNGLKTKLLTEMAFILDWDLDQLEEVVDFTKLANVSNN